MNRNVHGVIAGSVLAWSMAFGVVPIATAQDASSAAVAVVVEEGGKLIKKALGSAFSEHQRFHPEGSIARIPLKNLGGSRISYNFAHTDWTPRGAPAVKARVTFHGVSDGLRDGLRLVLKADKQMRKDRDRNHGRIVRNGDVIEFDAGTSMDRALYFVERGSELKGRLPATAYVQLERLPN